jgi:hypothetical protein
VVLLSGRLHGALGRGCGVVEAPLGQAGEGQVGHGGGVVEAVGDGRARGQDLLDGGGGLVGAGSPVGQLGPLVEDHGDVPVVTRRPHPREAVDEEGVGLVEAALGHGARALQHGHHRLPPRVAYDPVALGRLRQPRLGLTRPPGPPEQGAADAQGQAQGERVAQRPGRGHRLVEACLGARFPEEGAQVAHPRQGPDPHALGHVWALGQRSGQGPPPAFQAAGRQPEPPEPGGQVEGEGRVVLARPRQDGVQVLGFAGHHPQGQQPART